MKVKLRFVPKGISWLYLFILLIITTHSNAQQTAYQQVTKKCYTGPTLSMDNTTGTLVGNVNFSSIDIPLGHKIVDVIVEIVWSKTDDGSCTAVTGVPADLSHVGFVIQAPFGSTRYLATSALTGPFSAPVTSSSFTGISNVVRDTIVFRDATNSLLPAGLPVPGRDTVQPNNNPLRFYCGANPHGSWSVGGIDDAPALGPQLCIHSYCITLVTCDANRLKASCKTNASVNLGAAGLHSFSFPDLDSLSDVSCMVKNISFSPVTVNCSDVGATIPVTMTIRDHLDSVEVCSSLVSVFDNTAPIIANCFPSIWGDVYLGSDGRDTFWADSISVVDNCAPLIKEVRPFSGGVWKPYIVLSCVTGFQQFSARVTDPSGNTHSCNIIVNVRDTVAPTAVCGQTTAYLTNAPNGAVTVSAIDFDGGSYDVCPPVIGRWIGSRFAPPPVYTCADLGIDTVRLIVADASGNLDTCDNAIVTIVDTIAPVAICQNDTIYLNGAGVATAYASNLNNTSIDTCGIDSININGFASLSYNCSHVNTVQGATLNVFDASGNSDSCIAWITVRDTLPPIANCKNRAVYLGASGQVTIQADSLNNNSVDLCTGTYLTFDIAGNASVSYDCSNLASNPNATILTVRDSFGNASTCTAQVTVWDTIAPTANCATPTIYLNAAGIATLSADLLSAGSWDNCTLRDSFVNTIGSNFTTFNCSSIFSPQSATLIVEDAQGNTASCPTVVYVEDTIAPTALCKSSITIQLNGVGEAVAKPASIDSNSTDNCGLVEYLINGMDSVLYTCADLGSQTVVLTVRDSSGNIASCPSQIMVEDRIDPLVTCQTITTYLNPSGLASITPNDVLVYPNTSDNCTIATTSFSTGSNITFNCDSIGTRTVRVLVTDGYGNTSTCVTTVTILDTIAPIASCRPVPYTVQLDSTGIGCITALDIDNGSSDLCNLDTLLVNGVDSFCFNCSNIGNNVVTLSALDSSGNQSSCSANIIVADGINPTALCHDTTIYLDATGVVTIYPTDIDAGSSDNCTFSYTINGMPSISYTCSQIGINSVQLVVTDNSSNVAHCPANVTIIDSLGPVANCVGAGNLTVYLDSSCFASIPAVAFNNGSTDNCVLTSSAYTVDGLFNKTFNATNLSTNPNTVTLTVTDNSGNMATCQTSVMVIDTIKPIVVCQPDTLQLGASGTVVAMPNMVHGHSIDNCTNGLLYTLNGQSMLSFDCSHLGLNNVTLTATDSSGNFSTCSTTILIEDNVAPNASCLPTYILNLNSGGTLGILTPNQIDLGSSDNCAIVSYALSRDTFSCSDIYTNPHTVTLRVTDASGNIDSCTSQITIEDNIAPIISCQTATVYLGGSGSVNVTPATVLVPPTGDNCIALTSTFAGQGSNIVYTCDSIGVHPVRVVVTDISGTSAYCLTSITVLDTVRPIANCLSTPYTVQLDSFGQGFVTPQQINNASFDYCGISTMLVNGVDTVFYSCANIGTTAVTLSVLDGSGNQSTCVANIVVNDPISPTARCRDTTLYLGSNGVTTITPNLIDAGSSDNCFFTTTINGLGSVNFNCNQVGTNTTQLVVTDLSNNTTPCAANVTILDTISPTANCIGAGVLTVYLDNTCFASIPAAALNSGSTDNCIGALTYTVGGLPNATFNATNLTSNPNPITLVVRDATGNISTCNTTVIVTDTIAPVVTCRPDTIQLTGPNVIINPLMINAGSTDNCSVPTLTINGQASLTLDCRHIGLTPVTLIGTDISGNVDSCFTSVYVEDVAAPIANCHLSSTAYLRPSDNLAVLSPIDVDNSSTDNCSIMHSFLSRDTFNCHHVRNSPHSVKLFVVDPSGNSDSCVTQLTVRDTISPIAICRNDTFFFSGTTVHIGTIDIDGGSSDNCALQSFRLSQDTFNCPDLGLNNIVMTVTDSSGNIGTCVAQITILDTTASAVAGNTQILCTTDSTYLAANPVSGSLVGTWSSASGAVISNPNDPNTLIYNIPVGEHVFYWTLSNATCPNLSMDSVKVHVIAPSLDTANAGINQHLCEDSTIQLAASPLTSSTGLWIQSSIQANAGVVIADPTDSLTNVSGLAVGNAYLFVWQLSNGLCGVHSSDTVVVIVDPVPTDQAIAGADITCSPDSLYLDATPSGFGSGQWSTPSTAIFADSSFAKTLVYNFTQDTIPMIWSLSNGACLNYSKDTMYIILDDVWPNATVDSFNLAPDGSIATIDVILNDMLPPAWDIMIHTPMVEGQMTSLGNGQFEVDINNAVLNQYFIYEICNADCPVVCDTALVTIAIQPPGDCYTPTAFTPNGDGQNDYFVIPCLANTTDKGALYIFNRWGNLVFETDNYQSDWDGSHRDQPLPDGTYFYILQIEGKKPQNGSIEIKR